MTPMRSICSGKFHNLAKIVALGRLGLVALSMSNTAIEFPWVPSGILLGGDAGRATCQGYLCYPPTRSHLCSTVSAPRYGNPLPIAFDISEARLSMVSIIAGSTSLGRCWIEPTSPTLATSLSI